MDLFEEERFVSRYIPLMDMLDNLVKKLLLNEDAEWSDEHLKWFLNAHVWISRLRRFGSVPLIKRDKGVLIIYETIAKLNLYVSWLEKKFLCTFPENWNVKYQLDKCFAMFMPCDDFVDNVRLCKKAGMLRRIMGAPKPGVEIRFIFEETKPDNITLFYVFYMLASRLRSQVCLFFGFLYL